MLRTQTQSSPLLRTRTQSSPSPRTRIQRTKWSLTSRQGYILRSFPKTQKDAILGILMQSSPFSFPLLKFFPLHLHLNFFRQQLFPPTKLFCIIYTLTQEDNEKEKENSEEDIDNTQLENEVLYYCLCNTEVYLYHMHTFFSEFVHQKEAF